MEVSDDLYTGPVGPNGFVLPRAANPTRQYGLGPLGRALFLNIVPTAIAAASLVVLQVPTINVPLTLVAGAGITTAFAPDGSQRTVYVLDVPRSLSFTSGANISAVSFLVTGFDYCGQQMTQLVTGPNIATVNTLKAFASILSIVPTATSASTVSVGVADVFGLPYKAIDAGYIISAKWANALAQNAGTFVAADSTSPATNLTGDVRGTFAQAGAASNGANRLVICQHVDDSQCGSNATRANALGVTQS